jgi:hypothetical protein
MLRRILAARFDAVPEEVVQRIENCTDVERLAAAAEQVQTIERPEDLPL